MDATPAPGGEPIQPFPTLSTLALVLGLATAGCLGTATEGLEAASVPAPVALGADAEGCHESIAVFLVAFDHLATFLPPGFAPRDAQGLLGTPQPVGKGAAFLTAYECERMESADGPAGFAEGGIYVETPTLEPALALEPGLDFYTPEFYPTAPGVADALVGHGVAARSAQVEVAHDVTPALVTGALAVADEKGPLFSYEYAAPARSTLSGIVRLWQPTAQGPAYFSLDIPGQPIAQGAVTACSLREGWVYADIVGTTTCEPGDALAMLVLEQEWDGTFHLLAGHRVADA